MEHSNEYTRSLINSGLSVIPITEGEKKPHWILGKNHDLLTRRATKEEVEKWIAAGVTSWGVAGGAVSSNLVTLDFDEKYYPGLFDLWYDKLAPDQKAIVGTCVISSTRNGGHHVRYRTETLQPTTKISRIFIHGKVETTSEVRGEGSYALIPPSAGYTFVQGDLEHLPLVTNETHKEFIDILRTFNEVEDEPVTEHEWKAGDSTPGDRPGDRLNALATWEEILEPHGWVRESENQWRRPGKDAGEGISATTDFNGVPMFYVFSTAATPFTENRGYSKFAVFALLNHDGNFKEAARAATEMYPLDEDSGEEGKDSQASNVLKEILSRKEVVLFHDETGDGYMAIDVSGHQEIWACKSQAIRRWLSSEVYRLKKKAPASETVKSILAVLEGKAWFDGPEIQLHNRVAWLDGELWYDLTNKLHQSVRINKDGWEIIDKTPILFKRYSHQKAQQMPTRSGDVRRLLSYVNIQNPEHKLLLLVSLISSFIPDFPHPMLVVYGVQGSSKSTLAKLKRLICDPSTMDVVALPKSINELVQVLAHHHYLFFDNVSHVSEEASDILCKVITGSGFSKRELYSDDDDIIYVLRRCLGINGINLVTLRPDLLERSILLELDRIDAADRKQEQELYSEFAEDLPSILGGVFDVLVRTLKVRPSIAVSDLPRMADFTIWGCAIAEALGYTKEEFLTAYRNNIARQSEMLVNENTVASGIVLFMDDRDSWRGTATELLQELSLTHGVNPDQDRYWPKSPALLSRRLNEVSPHLRQIGLFVTISTTGQSRWIRIEKVTRPTDDTDGTDGVSGEGNE